METCWVLKWNQLKQCVRSISFVFIHFGLVFLFFKRKEIFHSSYLLPRQTTQSFQLLTTHLRDKICFDCLPITKLYYYFLAFIFLFSIHFFFSFSFLLEQHESVNHIVFGIWSQNIKPYGSKISTPCAPHIYYFFYFFFSQYYLWYNTAHHYYYN